MLRFTAPSLGLVCVGGDPRLSLMGIQKDTIHFGDPDFQDPLPEFLHT